MKKALMNFFLILIILTHSSIRLSNSCDKTICLLPNDEVFCYHSETERLHQDKAPLCSQHLNATEYIILENNSFEMLPTGFFDTAPKALQIIIENHNVPLKVTPRMFANLTHLETVRILNCGVETLPDDTFFGTHNLRELELGQNKIKSLSKTMLRDLNELTALKVHHNEFENLPNDLFQYSKKLSVLDLSYNKLTHLSHEIFTPFNNLVTLRLDHNSLKEISEYHFLSLSNLRILELSSNQLNTEDSIYNAKHTSTSQYLQEHRPKEDKYLYMIQKLIGELSLMTLLNVSRNGIEGTLIVNRWRHSNTGFTLDLSHNKVTEVIVEEKNLQLNNFEIHLERNMISKVTIKTDENEGSVRFPSVFIDDNPLECDCLLLSLVNHIHVNTWSRHVFVEPGDARCAEPVSIASRRVRDIGAEDLTCQLPQNQCPDHCLCTHRPLSHIPLELDCKTLPDPDMFKVLPYNATRLRLRSIPSGLKNLSSQVHVLNLTGLGLREVPVVPPTVQKLDLTYNQLTRVPVDLISVDGPQLKLAGNIFSCECPVDDIADLIENYIRVDDYLQLTCKNNLSISLVDTKNCIVSEVNVQRHVVMTSSSFIVVLLIVMTVLIVVFYKYWQEIYVFLYSRGWCLRCVSERELDQDKEFDAFVTFSHADREFVLDTLVPGLEAPPHGYKLCVHYRDWVIGEMITTQILHSVTSSRRTIVVLTDNYLNSEWAKHEFSLAHSCALRDGCARVIVVLMDDVVEEARMSPELRAYLSTNTYIERNDPNFWERIICAMPRRPYQKYNKHRVSNTGDGIEMSVFPDIGHPN